LYHKFYKHVRYIERNCIIDGYHRLNVNPKWPRKKVEEVRDPVQLAIARLIANVCRRTVSAEEKTEWLRQIAQLTGWTPKQIAANLPVSYQWVMKYLPDEFKDKEMKELALRRRAEEKHFIPCARCGVAVSMPIYLGRGGPHLPPRLPHGRARRTMAMPKLLAHL